LNLGEFIARPTLSVHCAVVELVWFWAKGSNIGPSVSISSRTKEPFLSVPISPKFPEELKLPCAEKLPSLYAREKVPEFVAIHISPAQLKGLSGSAEVGRTWRGMPDFV
jgi:hypothetical protein